MKRRFALLCCAVWFVLVACMLSACGGNPEKLVISRRVTTIKENQYKDNKKIRTVEIPDTVTEIGRSAFSGCENLESVVIPASVKRIDDFVFNNCKNLRSVTICGDMEKVGYCVFSGCDSISEVIVQEGVTIVPDYLFEDHPALTDISLPQSLQKLNGFNNCPALTHIEIPGSVTQIGGLNGCPALKEITLPDSVIYINGLNDCTGLTQIELPDSLVNISGFSGCTGLTEIAFPGSVHGVNDSAFSGCTSLTEVVIPESVNNIGNQAFEGCANLTAVTIVGSEEGILFGSRAFADCANLREITFPGFAKAADNSDYRSPFGDCEKLAVIHVTGSRIDSEFHQLVQDCPRDVTIDFVDPLTEIGDGAFAGTVLTEGIEDFLHDSYEGAEDIINTEEKIAELEGATVIPVDKKGNIIGELYTRLPESLRAYDGRTADYALVVVRDFRRSNQEYITSDMRTVGSDEALADAYLCDRNGAMKLLCRIVNTPGLTGSVSKWSVNGMDVYGDVRADPVSMDQVWERIDKFF